MQVPWCRNLGIPRVLGLRERIFTLCFGASRIQPMHETTGNAKKKQSKILVLDLPDLVS